MATAMVIADKAAYSTMGDTGPTYREWAAALIAAQLSGRDGYTVCDVRNEEAVARAAVREEAIAAAAVRLADALCARLAQS